MKISACLRHHRKREFMINIFFLSSHLSIKTSQFFANKRKVLCAWNHLQLIPFFIAIFCHELRSGSTELLRFVWHLFGVVFQLIKLVATLDHQHVRTTDFTWSWRCSCSKFLNIRVRSRHEFRYRTIWFATCSLANCQKLKIKIRFNEGLSEKLTQFFSIYALCSATEKSFEETFLRWFWHFTLKIKFTQHIVVVLTESFVINV